MAVGLDDRKVGEFAERVLGILAAGAAVEMVYLGDRLGLYGALAAGGPATSAELASRTGCAERYLREWLAQQASLGFVTYDAASGRFDLPAEHAPVLMDGDSPVALGGAFEAMVGWQLGVDSLADAFCSGRGIGWATHDDRVYRGVARFFGAAYRASLVDEWVPALGLEPVLRQGARVADVGCGRGVTTVLMAEAFPNSRFVGIDAHEPSIGAARAAASAAGVTERVRFEVATAADLAGGPYDAIWFVDCLHDLGDPVGAAGRARDQLAEQGTVAVVEPFAGDDLPANLAANPGAGLHYAASTALCVPHSLSEPGGAALGGQAGGRRLADILSTAGLGRCDRVADTPVHSVYAARP